MDEVRGDTIKAPYTPRYAESDLVAATFNLMRTEIEDLRYRYDQLYNQVNRIDPGDE